MSSSVDRHQWLEDARIFSTGLLAAIKCDVPDMVRVTIGFPSVGGRGKRLGECWSPSASADSHGEIFVSPKLSDSVEIMGVVIHELVHAAVGTEAKHGKLFSKPAKAVGLEGKMTATTVGPALRTALEAWIAERGPYPAGALSMDTRKKQTTRLLKAECEECGYVVRVTKKWVDEVGAPHCPDHGAMTVEGMSETDPDEDTPELEIVDEGMTDEDHILTGYRVTQDDPEHIRFEVFAEDERAKAEAKARQWSKTGKERIAIVEAHLDGELQGSRAYHGGFASPVMVGAYPLEGERFLPL